MTRLIQFVVVWACGCLAYFGTQASAQQDSFNFVADTWQKDLGLHAVIPIASASPIKECAAYCSLRDAEFL